MIVCHCEVISEHAVVATIDNGARTLDQVCKMSGAGQNCGGCIFSLEQILCEHDETVNPSHLEVASCSQSARAS